MERCPNCGNRLNSIDVLCPKCGAVVEVIQIKSSISSASETAAEAAQAGAGVQKKDFSQSFIVYNEDFPTEDAESEALDNAGPVDELKYEPLAAPDEEPLANAPDYDPSHINTGINDASLLENQSASTQTPGNEDEFDYSQRYLEHLKNIQLPEIDDMQSFDPDEFMREYKRSRADEQADDSQQPVAEKRWLEIEEAFDTEEPPSDAGINDKDIADESPVVERRYRSERVERIRPAKQTPEKRSKPKKYNVAVTVLLWLVVSAAFLCCFIFFDNYVQKAYGSYDGFIYSITDGKIDIAPGN